MEDDEEVAVPGYVRDVEELLRDYVQRGDPSLAAFKAVWRARRFSFVHDACPKDIDPRRFLQLLFGAALGELLVLRLAVPSACGAPPATHCSPDATAAAAAGAAAAPETPSPDATAASADAPAAAANGNAAGAAEARQAAERVPFTHGQGAREGVAREEGEEGVEGGKGEEGRLFVGGRLLSAVGAVFTLYCLFNTQRTAPYPPTLIYLPIDSLRLLLLFAREAPHHRAWDAVAALQTLFFGPHPSHPFSPPPASSSSSSPFPNSSPPSSAFVVGAMPLPQQLQGDVQQRAAQARRLVEQQLRVMKQKLFAHLPIERHIQSDACEAVDVEQADAACWLYDNSLQRLRTCGLLTEGASFAQEGELAAVFSAYSAAREAAVGAIGQRES